jgi:hypothetical protein
MRGPFPCGGFSLDLRGVAWYKLPVSETGAVDCVPTRPISR